MDLTAPAGGSDTPTIPSPIPIPTAFAAAIGGREGAAGRSWLAGLGDLIGDLVEGFGCIPDGAPSHGGVALVLPVRRRDEPAVLKVSFPHPGNLGEAPALRHLGGRAAVRLLDADEDRFALLLERAGPVGLDQSGLPPEAVIEVAGGVARRLAVPVPADAGLTALADTTAGWRDELDRQAAAHLGAIPPEQLARARSTIAGLAGDRPDTLLHGDLHAGNVLAAEREDWLGIDPKGWTGSAAYDAFTVVAATRGTLLEHGDPAAELGRRTARFAIAAGVDLELARACVQARAVSSLFYQLAAPEGDWFDLELLRAAAALRP